MSEIHALYAAAQAKRMSVYAIDATAGFCGVRCTACGWECPTGTPGRPDVVIARYLSEPFGCVACDLKPPAPE